MKLIRKSYISFLHICRGTQWNEIIQGTSERTRERILPVPKAKAWYLPSSSSTVEPRGSNAQSCKHNSCSCATFHVIQYHAKLQFMMLKFWGGDVHVAHSKGFWRFCATQNRHKVSGRLWNHSSAEYHWPWALHTGYAWTQNKWNYYWFTTMDAAPLELMWLCLTPMTLGRSGGG